MPSPRLRKSRSPGVVAGADKDTVTRMQVPALDAIDVEPAVAVEVEQSDASRKRLGQQTPWGSAVVEREAQSNRHGVVNEFRGGSRRITGGPGDLRGPDSFRVAPCRGRDAEVGESIAERGAIA